MIKRKPKLLTETEPQKHHVKKNLDLHLSQQNKLFIKELYVKNRVIKMLEYKSR